MSDGADQMDVETGVDGTLEACFFVLRCMLEIIVLFDC